MLIYGYKPVQVKHEKSRNLKCTTCDTHGSIEFYLMSSHAHIYWIPLFPYRMKGRSICTNCGEELKPKKMPDQMRRAYDMFRAGEKPKIWQFSGVAIVAVLIGVSFYFAQQTGAKEAEYLASPREGDVYYYKESNDEYTTMLVSEITEDTLYLIPNEYAVNKRSGAGSIDKEENYGEYMYGVARDEIERMYKDDEIYEIDRD